MDADDYDGEVVVEVRGYADGFGGGRGDCWWWW